MDKVTECYQKPFHLFHYNRPKQPELPKTRKIKPNKEPKIPLKLNNATKLRNKAIKLYDIMDIDPPINYRQLTEQSEQKFFDSPVHPPRHTKTSQYRYKWVRDVPVVSCRFTEYCMMYRKPPFTFEKTLGPTCGNFRLKRMKLESPEKNEPQVDTESSPEFPSILQ